MNRSIIVLFSLLSVAPAAADVQLRIQDMHSGVSTFSSNGRLARIDDARRDQYAIIDFDRGEIQMVDPARGQVMVSRIADGDAAATGGQLDVRLEDRGGGPRIAGYSTRKLALKAGGEDCGTVYTSSKLMREPGIRALARAMRGMQQMAQRMSAGLGGMLGSCRQASLQMSDTLQQNGLPMRMLDSQGRTISEVLEVDTDKRLAANHYQVPAGLARVDMDQQVGEAVNQAREMMKNMPDMSEIMQQMQQNGGEMNAEMQQQLEKMQKMLQQMQPQQ